MNTAHSPSILEEDLARIHRNIAGQHTKFAGSTLLITGAAGFLGYYFVNYLVRYAQPLGIRKVIALDSFIVGNPAWLESLKSAFPDTLEVHRFDIAHDRLDSIPACADASFVIHAASIASPTFYRKFPLETVDGNIWGLRHILDFYRDRSSLRGLLFFSSSEIYGDPEAAAIPTPETYRGNVACHGPRACYDESKRFGETLCWIYGTHFNMPITVARPFNNYGPGMRIDDRRLPADMAQCVMNGRNIVLLSDGTPTRTFCYITDAITGYFLCLLYGRYDVFNIGMDRPEISVRQVADLYVESARRLWNYSGKVEFQSSDDPAYLTDNPNRRCPNIDKARSLLGYAPAIDISEGIHRYLRFLQEESRS